MVGLGQVDNAPLSAFSLNPNYPRRREKMNFSAARPGLRAIFPLRLIF